jgi:16S rRNA (cytosine1402-N4)-methyltransferase
LEDDLYHEPVLLNEVTALVLANKGSSKAKLYVDCTLGGGGYTKRILDETSDEYCVVGIDRDENAVRSSRK